MLYDIGARDWSDELCALFDVPRACLPDGRAVERALRRDASPSARRGLAVPVSGIAGDQQAALFGQACVEPGMTKNTYGTGSFVLTNVGPTLPEPVDGLLTTIAWSLGARRRSRTRWKARSSSPAPRSSGCATASAIIADAAETGPLAASVPDTGGVYVVPAFTGLGSPWWDPYARGTIVGITRGTSRAHLARAVVEAMAFQTADVVDAITRASGTAPAEMRVDGGASVMDLLCQFQADLLGVPVRRAAVQETTALGAAFLAGHRRRRVGLARRGERDAGSADASFTPAMDATPSATRAWPTWHRAVERSRDWAHD